MTTHQCINGRVKIDGASLVYANQFTLDMDSLTVEAESFGGDFAAATMGAPEWGGTIQAYHDQDAKLLYSFATDGASHLLALYPNYDNTAVYWTGYACLTAYETDEDTEEFAGEVAEFVGAGSLLSEPTGKLLLETGWALLLETGGYIRLEALNG